MKKNFLKIIFAMTMGVSLFSWKSVGANVNAKTVEDTNISMDTSECHTFDGEDSIVLADNSIFRLNGRTITPIGTGQEAVTVGTKTYNFNVSLPSGYNEVEYINFHAGARVDTGCAFDSDYVHVKFTYSGNAGLDTWGFQNGGYRFYAGTNCIYIGAYYKAIQNSVDIGVPTICNTFDMNTFDYTSTQSGCNLVFDNTNYSCTWTIPKLVNNATFRFGHKNGDGGRFSGKLYSLFIECGGVIKVNYVPCYNQSNGKYGFLNIVNNEFVTSSTSIPLKYIGDSINVSYIESENTVITPYEGTLYLGNYVDFANMDGKLIIDDGIELTGTIPDESITVGEDDLDLTVLFGSMSAGVVYPLTLTNGSYSQVVNLIKSENVSDLHVTINKDYSELYSKDVTATAGTMVLYNGSEEITSTINKFKGRGNHFQPNIKNSFNLNINDDLPLIPGAGEQHKYALIGNAGSLMENQVAYKLYEQLVSVSGALDNAIHFRMVNLFLNSKPMGLYMLTEKAEINSEVVNIKPTKVNISSSTQRLVKEGASNITEQEQALLDIGIAQYRYCPGCTSTQEGGFMIEAGHSFANANNISGFVTSHGNYWLLKDQDAATLSQITKIATYIQNAENALFSETGINSKGEHYSDIYDLPSIAREYLIRSFMGDGDFYITSNYLYVDGDDNGLKGKIYAGPVWDFDNSQYGYYGTYSKATTNDTAYKFRDKLFQKGDFVKIMNDINKDDFVGILDKMVDPNNTLSPSVYSYYNDYLSARTVDSSLWYWNTVSSSNNVKNSVISRTTQWKNIWSDATNNLRGVVISKNGKTLTANANGATEGYQWYKINVSGKTYSGSEIEGATSASYTAAENGLYYVVVNGTQMPGTGVTSMTSNVLNVGQATVSFDMQGHGTQIDSQTIYTGEKVSEPSDPYVAGYLFKGWFKESDCLNAWDFENDTVENDTTLYALWVQGGSWFDGNVSISLKDNTWINFYLSIDEDSLNEFSFKFTLRNGNQNSIDDQYIAKVNGKWRVSVPLLPYQLADDVVIYMYDNQNRLLCNSVTLSVRSYAAYALTHSSDENYKNALKALLNYGAAVQIWQDYYTDDLANSILNNDQNQQPGN